MEGATHFIEIYKDIKTGKIFHSPTIAYNQAHIRPIENLKKDLEFTKGLLFIKTIAVWYIKPKVKTP